MEDERSSLNPKASYSAKKKKQNISAFNTYPSPKRKRLRNRNDGKMELKKKKSETEIKNTELNKSSSRCRSP